MIGTVLRGAPVLLDPDEARELLERELAQPVYREAEPTVIDRIAQAVGDFLGRLFSSELPADWGPAVAVIAAVVVVVLVVAGLLIWGRPRATPRSRRPIAPLFGVDDDRSAADLRREAEREAAAGRWDQALAVRFRALARGLVERAIIDPPPGATAQGFAHRAAAAFPDERTRLAASASAFDDVRYLRRPGTADLYRGVAALDDALAEARPAREPAL